MNISQRKKRVEQLTQQIKRLMETKVKDKSGASIRSSLLNQAVYAREKHLRAIQKEEEPNVRTEIQNLKEG